MYVCVRVCACVCAGRVCAAGLAGGRAACPVCPPPRCPGPGIRRPGPGTRDPGAGTRIPGPGTRVSHYENFESYETIQLYKSFYFGKFEAQGCDAGDLLEIGIQGKPGEPSKSHQTTVPATLPKNLPKKQKQYIQNSCKISRKPIFQIICIIPRKPFFSFAFF